MHSATPKIIKYSQCKYQKNELRISVNVEYIDDEKTTINVVLNLICIYLRDST